PVFLCQDLVTALLLLLPDHMPSESCPGVQKGRRYNRGRFRPPVHNNFLSYSRKSLPHVPAADLFSPSAWQSLPDTIIPVPPHRDKQLFYVRFDFRRFSFHQTGRSPDAGAKASYFCNTGPPIP